MKNIVKKLINVFQKKSLIGKNPAINSESTKSFEELLAEIPPFSFDSLIGIELQEKIDFIKSINKKLILEKAILSSQTIKSLKDLQNDVLKECGFDFSNTLENAFDYGDRAIAKAELYDPIGAIEDFSNAILINPNYENAYLWRGEEKIKLDKFESALIDFNFVLKINPKNIDALTNIEKVNFFRK